MNNTLCSNEQALLGIQLILFVRKSSILCLWQSRHFVQCRATLQSPASIWGAHLHCNCWRKTKAWRLFPLLFAGTWRVFIQKRITCFIHIVDGRQHALLRERVDGYQQKRESPFFTVAYMSMYICTQVCLGFVFVVQQAKKVISQSQIVKIYATIFCF